MSGSGAILQNSAGNVVWAILEFYGTQTNMMAEARTMLDGLRKCRKEGIIQVALEADSLIHIQALRRQIECRWGISHEVREIQRILGYMEYSLSHTYRENNNNVLIF